MTALIDSIKLGERSVEELEALIRAAQDVKRKRQTPMPLINGRIDSVRKHVLSCIRAIKLLEQSEGVPQAKWDIVKAELAKLGGDLEAAKASAGGVNVSNRRRQVRK